jgi:hypothetical protein
MDSLNWSGGIASRRTLGGCHFIHLSYGRTRLILQEYPHDGVIVWRVAVGRGMEMATNRVQPTRAGENRGGYRDL